MRTAFLGALFYGALVGCVGNSADNTPEKIPIVLIEETEEIAAEPTPTLDPVATPRPYRLRPGELVLASSPGDIPAIFANDNLFVSVEQGDLEWFDEEPVMGVEINGDARAYPVRILSLHEIVNDVVGGQPIAVTWCPLCYTAITFNRVLDRELTFGASGYLFHNNLVMYDHQSNTLWSQVLGEGIKGAYRTERLEIIPSVLTTWAAWKQTYPETKVLSAIQMGMLAEDVIDPYAGYYTSGAPGLGGQEELDERLLPKALVVGLRAAKIARAYALVDIITAGVINDQIDLLPVLLVYNVDFQTVFTYDRRVGERTLVFSLDEDTGNLRDIETDTVWDAKSGVALAGELKGETLVRLSAPLVFWFAWSDIHKGTELYVLSE